MHWKDFPKTDHEGKSLEVSFWRKLKFYLGGKLGLWYMAWGFQHVPFYRQKDKRGNTYQLPTGTKCYLALNDLVLELRGDRWYALGESEYARKLNREVDKQVKRAEQFDAEAFFAAVKNEMSNDAEALIRQEMLRATKQYSTDSSS